MYQKNFQKEAFAKKNLSPYLSARLALLRLETFPDSDVFSSSILSTLRVSFGCWLNPPVLSSLKHFPLTSDGKKVPKKVVREKKELRVRVSKKKISDDSTFQNYTACIPTSFLCRWLVPGSRGDSVPGCLLVDGLAGQERPQHALHLDYLLDLGLVQTRHVLLVVVSQEHLALPNDPAFHFESHQ